MKDLITLIELAQTYPQFGNFCVFLTISLLFFLLVLSAIFGKTREKKYELQEAQSKHLLMIEQSKQNILLEQSKSPPDPMFQIKEAEIGEERSKREHEARLLQLEQEHEIEKLAKQESIAALRKASVQLANEQTETLLRKVINNSYSLDDEKLTRFMEMLERTRPKQEINPAMWHSTTIKPVYPKKRED